MAMTQEKKDKIKAAIRARAQMFGQTIEHAAADQIEDMKTQALDSILRGAIFGFVLGLVLGSVFF